MNLLSLRKPVSAGIALVLLVFLLTENLARRQQDVMLPTVSDRFILQPDLQTKKKTFAAGTAFVVKLEGFPRPVILSALHLIGPAGGYPEDVPADKLAQVIDKVTVVDQFTGKNRMWVS